MDNAKKQKTSKIVNIIVNVLVVIILLLALLVTINNLMSSKKGYVSMFGNAFLVCQTNSMVGEKPEEYADKPNGFAPGDLLRVRILSDEEKKHLEPGDIISFYALKDRERIINSHRIIAVDEVDGRVRYTTKGDNPNATPDPYVYATGDEQYYVVIGIVEDNLGGIGNVFNFFQSSTGFLVCIVIPSFLVVIYFAYVFIKELMKTKKAKTAAADKAQLKEELLAELRAQGIIANVPGEAPLAEGVPPAEEVPGGDEKPAENVSPAEESESGSGGKEEK